MSGGIDPRIEAAERLLREHGLDDARVTAAGPEGEIAVVSAPAESVAQLAELAPALKALGFLYVSLDLGGGAGEA